MALDAIDIQIVKAVQIACAERETTDGEIDHQIVLHRLLIMKRTKTDDARRIALVEYLVIGLPIMRRKEETEERHLELIA